MIDDSPAMFDAMQMYSPSSAMLKLVMVSEYIPVSILSVIKYLDRRKKSYYMSHSRVTFYILISR